MPKVFVTQEVSKINYSMAMDYGDVVFLTQDEYKPQPTDHRMNNIIKHEMMKNFMDYVAGEDYILTSGSPVSIFIAAAMAAKRSPVGQLASHKILKWNNQTNKYDLCLV